MGQSSEQFRDDFKYVRRWEDLSYKYIPEEVLRPYILRNGVFLFKDQLRSGRFSLN